MSQDAIDNVLVLNTGDDLYRFTAMTANLVPLARHYAHPFFRFLDNREILRL
jgi:hypothetical protein